MAYIFLAFILVIAIVIICDYMEQIRVRREYVKYNHGIKCQNEILLTLVKKAYDIDNFGSEEVSYDLSRMWRDDSNNG